MLDFRLEPGLKNIKRNVTRLMSAGYSSEDAHTYAYQYARNHSARRMSHIHTRSQQEQRKR